MTGTRPRTHGLLHNAAADLSLPVLPDLLREAGYQTMLSGKLHLHPKRKRYGFEEMKLADGAAGRLEDNDYSRFLNEHGLYHRFRDRAHGIPGNSWTARPWHLDERFHVATWAADQAIEMLETRDPTRPFFLNLSFFHPHPPCTPPSYFFEKYMDQALPEPIEAAWSRRFDEASLGLDPNPVLQHTLRGRLKPRAQREWVAAYLGSIEHIDTQIQRVMQCLPANTLILFCSDHGEMLGDHQFIGKQVPYEGSARVPMIIRPPKGLDLPSGGVLDAPVELMDVAPTLLDAAGVPGPETFEGRSLLGLMKGGASWRDHIHGECTPITGESTGMHYLTNGREKFVWWPGEGREQFFDLDDDPSERYDLASSPGYADRVAAWRSAMITELADRPEGFVQCGQLRRLQGPTSRFVSPTSVSAFTAD